MLRRLAPALFLIFPLIAQKRPLTHADYDSWRHIQNQQLSNDGRYLAYALFPEQGDGELVVRDLTTGKEVRQPIGELPPPPRPNYAIPQPEEAPPPTVNLPIRFTPDSRTLVSATFATHAAVEKAKLEKRKPEDMPKGDVIVINLASGTVFRANRVKNFQLPSEANGHVAYLQTPEKHTEKSADPDAPPAKKIETGDLVVRNLSDGSERRFADVTEYTLTKDAKALVYAAAGHKSELNGVFAVTPGDAQEPITLLSGKGKYEKLAWDEDQRLLAFLSDKDEASEQHPRFKLYTWDRHSATATQLVSTETAGFKEGWVLSDKANIIVSKGGTRVFFGTAPAARRAEPPDPRPADERVSVDLWSWKDDYIQPMQKIRATVERERSYRASYDLAGKKFIQLSDPTMYELAPGEDGTYAIGSDDRAYRRMQEYDERYEDAYLVDARTGERKLIAPKHLGRMTWSPDSKYAIYFNGKDWITISVPDGRETNLTAKLGVSFGREEWDAPGPPLSYTLAGWTKNGQYVLIYDRFDIWRCKPDGSSAINLTAGYGRKNHLAFRVVRFEHDDPESRWLDPARPLLLRTENEDTHESGFYRTNINDAEPPTKLIMAAKYFATPIKARDADVYVTATSTFSEYPDLLVTDGSFHEFRKVTDANPQMAGILWGSAELIRYNSTDGIPLRGILYKPENFDPQKKYPLMVYIYERLTQGLNLFIEPKPQHTINVSYYVSNGYLVLEPDIAYKIGYPGQSALNCVLPAIQSVVNKGFVNEKAIGIQGHSWGGYQIAYMVTRTNRFRAAAAGAPVADMISAYDGIRWGPGIPRQFQYERTQSRIGGSIWEYPLRYIENSPIFMADRVTTPLLMIHNDADDAVPWYQGIEYFLALRRLNKEVYMFTYNGEPHGLRRRANQKDYAMRLQQFFDYYLKGALKPEWMEEGIPYIEKPGITITDSDQQ